MQQQAIGEVGQMTTAMIKTAIDDHNKKIIDYQHQLDNLRPAFLFDYETIAKLDEILQDTIACRSMLMSMLKDGEQE